MRALAVLAVAALAAGCGKAKLEAAKTRANEAAKATAEVEASLPALEQALATRKASLSARQSRRAAEDKRLRQLREALVERWGGDEALMKRQVAQANGRAFPAALVPVLERAQKEAGQTTRERRFGEAVQRKDLAELAATLLDWEVRAGVDRDEAADAAPEPPEDTCEKRRESHPSCEAFPAPAGAVLLCRVPEADLTLAAWSDRGRFVWQRLEGLGKARATKVHVLAPRVWLIETGADPPEEKVVPHLGRVSARRWLRAFELGESSGSARVHFPLELHGKPASLRYADLDRDGAEELVYLADGDVRALHVEGEKDVVPWYGLDTCQAESANPAAAPEELKAACAERAAK